MTPWRLRSVSLKFQLGEWILFHLSLPLQVRAVHLLDQVPPVSAPTPPSEELIAGSQGFLIRGLPITAPLPVFSQAGNYLFYAPLQYQHYYIDLGQSFESYQKKFSSKTRSTINRKIRKYAEYSGGSIRWQSYQTPDAMRDFFRQARLVSKNSYQERLLNAGIPDTEAFVMQAESLAAEQRVRAFVLFHEERPVSYLYCPVEDGILEYAYLGYDPAYMNMSVGTVLQWLALEQLFNETRFRYFDFTEGQSEHKRLFATDHRHCANVFIVKKTLRNAAIITSHMVIGNLSEWLGAALERLGIKTTIKRYFRFAS
jgi:CelD/BcsL family acetyltransferase involved in cellulose biosynthesis